MKRPAHRAHRIPAPSVDFRSAAQWDELADALEDPVSESSIDYDDEREVVDVLVAGTIRPVN